MSEHIVNYLSAVLRDKGVKVTLSAFNSLKY